jgi:hypothetical protein
MRTDLLITLWSLIAAAVTWWLAARHHAGALNAERAAALREIRHWQDQAGRARLRAAQLERELASFEEGCRQGREDVVSLVPTLLAAGGHQASCSCHHGTDGSL